MMNSPSMFSVEQLLKARQDGVPDYVVVPMLQKAMAQQQAAQRQAAMQQGAAKPPVAEQILNAAQHAVMSDHLARKSREEIPVPSREEAKGIDALPSGIDEGDYAHGGIIAFANGGSSKKEEDGSNPPAPEDDLITLPNIVSRHNNLFGQSKNDVPKDYSDVAANVNDARNLVDRAYSQFDNPDDFVTKWRGKGAKNLPIYKENVHNWLKESGWKEGDKLNLKDSKDVDRMLAAIANQEMSAHLKPEHIAAIASGKYKFTNGTPAKVNQSAPQQDDPIPTGGIANLAYPAAPEDSPMPNTPEETTPEYEGERFQKYFGEDPNAAKREARLNAKEKSLSEEKDKAPWLALMQAGLATMAGTSPYALANIGAGATAGLASYMDAKKDLNKSEDKLIDLRNEVEDAQYAHQMAVKKYGYDSAQANKKENELVKANNRKEKMEYNKDVAKHDLDVAELKIKEPYYLAQGRNLNANAEYTNTTKGIAAQNAADVRQQQADERIIADIEKSVNAQHSKWLLANPSATEDEKDQNRKALYQDAYMIRHKTPPEGLSTPPRTGIPDPAQFDRSRNR
jgi:hypothetical protein